MNKAKSKNLFNYAKKNFQEYNEKICNEEKERILINVSGALTKCLHCKMDELVGYVDKIVGSKFNLKKSFPAKMEYVENSVFFSQEVSNNLTSLNQQRVNLEHSYTIPSYQEVKDGLKDLELFLKRTEKYMQLPAENIRKKIENSLNKLKIYLKEKKKEDALKTYPLHIKKFLIYCKKDPDLLESQDANIYVQKVIDKEKIKNKEENRESKGNVEQQTISVIREYYKNILKRHWREDLENKPLKRRTYYPNIEPEKFKKFIEALPFERDKIIARIIYNKGLKLNEIVKLNVNDIPYLDLPEIVLSDLKKYVAKRTEGPLFLNPSRKRFGGKGIQTTFTKASNLSGIRLTPETLRQTHPKIKHKGGTINQQRIGAPRFGLLEGEYLTNEELNKLIQVCPKSHGELIYFIYHFGIHLKQFSNIGFEDINFPQRIIKIKPNKFCRANIVKIDKDIFKKFEIYLKKNKITSGKIFKNDPSMYTKWIKKYTKIAGINKMLNHSILSNSKSSEERLKPI